MRTRKQNKKIESLSKHLFGKIDPTIPSYKNHPAVVKKNKEMRKFLKDHNLIEQINQIVESDRSQSGTKKVNKRYGASEK